MEIIVDNFAGGGGASTGIEMAVGRSVDIAINHDPDAIEMHKVNHPGTKHYCENVWDVDPIEACAGKQVGLAWFSPDCTHFSRAKGGKPVDKNIRGLAWVTIRWAMTVRPRVIMLENVPEIQSWGPLGDDGKPIKSRSGETFDGFLKALTVGIPASHPAFPEMCVSLGIMPVSEDAKILIKGLGYRLEYRILRSCDYGAPTTRTRFYLIARCDDKPIVFPAPCYGKGLKPYHTAAQCIDWSISAKSIFERDKPLAENTLKRIAKGIEKFVFKSSEPFTVPETSESEILNAPFLIQYHSESGSGEVRGQSIDKPLMTVDTSPRYALAVAYIMKCYGGNYQGCGSAADKPLDTITSVDHNALVTMDIVNANAHSSGIGKTENGHQADVQAFLIKYFSSGTAKSINAPLDTITTKDRFALVEIYGQQGIIVDIGMRMLTPRELFRAQGFPDTYIIDRDSKGNPYPKSKQIARCGNAVTPPVPAALVRANLPEMCV